MSWRARAVFVSGTFRDMHEERDLLAARAFPALGEKLAEHYTILERVDLRVGVETRGLDDDHAKQELVLKVCLEDVRRCRPFLIVLVGDRYGWVPPLERARVAADEAGFRTAIEGKSVTALEIEFGLLGDPEQQTRSRIYFRKLDYTGMDEADAIVYSDQRAAVSTLVSPEERARAAERAAALAALERQLRTNPVLGPRCRDYPAVWDPIAKKVTGLGAFITDVVKDLLPEMIAEAKEQVAAARAGKLPTPLEQFVAERSRGFRGRAGMVARLCAHATQPGDADRRGLVVAGASGGGKSAIFARVYEELTEAKGTDFWLLAHAAGIDPRSTSVVSLLEDWVGVLAGKLGVENPLALPASSPDPREPRLAAGADKRPRPEEAFADLLAQAAKGRRVVLLLDALDRFERTPQAEQLTWLPAHLPANARLIATAVTGPETATLARRPDFAVESLVPLTKDEASEIAQSVYDRYHRQPNREAVRVLGEKAGPDGAPAHGNALWLVSALEEMNLLDGDDFRRAEAGTEGTDEDRLHAMVVGEARAMPGDVEGLYARIFARAGRRVSDDPREGRALARAFAVVIALSRGGFRERDLAAMIPGIARLLDPSGPTLAWDALAFASLRRALRAHLVRRGEDDRWDFHHRQARSAAERAYLPDAGTAKQIHALVADHLLGLPADDPLRESEAMYHLIHADAAEKAARLYAGELSPGGLAGCQETLARHALEAEGLAWVTGLLEIESLETEVIRALGERYLFDLNAVFVRMYVIPLRAATTRATERLFRRLLAANPGNSRLLRDVSASLENVGGVQMARGNLDAASAAYGESLRIARGLSDPQQPETLRDVSVSLDNLGRVEMARGNLDAACAAYGESLRIRRGLSDPQQPETLRDVSVSLNNVARVEMARGNLDAASAAYGESLRIARGLSDPQQPQTLRDVSVSLNNVARVEMARGNLDAASAAYGESLRIRRGLSDPQQPQTLRDVSVSLNNVARVEMARGNLDAASAAYGESLRIARGLSDPQQPQTLRDVSISLNNVGGVEMAWGNLDAASAAYGESLRIARGLSDPQQPQTLRDVSASLDRVGGVEMARGNLDAASAAYGEMLRICRGLSDPQQPQTLRDVSVSLNNVGGVEMTRGSLDAASAAYGESLRIRRGLSDPQQPQTLRDVSVSLNNVGGVEMARGKRGEARKNFEESLRILTNLQRDGKLFPQWRNDITWVKQQLARLDSETRGGVRVDIPRGHPGAAADRAAALNIAYLKDLAAWNALPFWKRLRMKKPEPPKDI
jgi:tetratricopeptide (TPR) repeat protein